MLVYRWLRRFRKRMKPVYKLERLLILRRTTLVYRRLRRFRNQMTLVDHYERRLIFPSFTSPASAKS